MRKEDVMRRMEVVGMCRHCRLQEGMGEVSRYGRVICWRDVQLGWLMRSVKEMLFPVNWEVISYERSLVKRKGGEWYCLIDKVLVVECALINKI